MTAAAIAASPSMADPMRRSISPPIWLPLKPGADRPRLLAVARYLAGDGDIGVVVPPVVGSVADADFREFDIAGAAGVELVLHLAG